MYDARLRVSRVRGCFSRLTGRSRFMQ